MASKISHKKHSPGLEFKAKEFHHHAKDQFWYLGMAILLVGLFIVSVRYQQYLLSAVIVAVGVAVFRLANLQPQSKTIKLNHQGLYWGDTFYGYHQLRAFWVAIQNNQATLYLERLNAAPQISFVVPISAAAEATNFLENYLPFHDHRSEPLADRFGRWLRL